MSKIFWTERTTGLRKRVNAMEEVQVFQQVAQYMDDLAGGTDPVGKGTIPAGSVLREEKMVKCFRYISEAVHRELDSRQEDQEEERMRVSAFLAETLKELGFTGNRYFLNTVAAEWLTREGYFTCIQDEDGNTDLHNCRPTPKGREAGFTESEPYEDGYVATLCGTKAQELILDHLDQLMAEEYARWEPLFACLTAEWIGQTGCSADTVSLKEMLERINGRLPEGLQRKFYSVAVWSWLIRNQLFEESMSNGKKRRSVTDEGKQNGFTGRGGLTPLAQRFLLDHLEVIARDMASGEAFRIPEPQE